MCLVFIELAELKSWYNYMYMFLVQCSNVVSDLRKNTT